MWRKPHERNWLFLAALLVSLSLPAWMALAQSAKRVDDNALKDAAKNKEEWISYNRDWAETRYSPLDQINASNVSRLGLAWSFDIPNVGDGTRQEGTPLISNGVIYSITPWSVVYAVNARTGKELWHSDPEVNQAVTRSRICCGVVNRGVALYEGKVIAPVVDGRIRALDVESGKVLWETQVTPKNQSYSLTMAPRVIKGGRVIIGASGGEYAVRGFFSAFDVKTGKELWKFYTVPGDPSKPFEQPIYAEWAKTWDKDKKWWVAGGGGPVWGSIAYDPDNDLVYVGTGQPGPWTEVSRGSGDNLCTDCIIAVKGATGKYVWHYQTTPGDDWDFDSIADIMLADLNINGKTRKVLMHAPKNGFFFVLDRVTGEFISAEPWVSVNWSSGADPKTGKMIVNPAARYGTTGINVTPGPAGGHVWPPWSYNPTTGLVYIPSTIGSGYNYQADPNYVIQSADIGETGRGRMQMGTGTGGGGRGGGGGAGGGAGRGGGAPAVAPGLDPNAQAGGAAPAAPRGGAAPGAAPGGAPGAAGGQQAAAGGGRGQGGGQGGGGGRGGGAPQGPQASVSRLFVLKLDGTPVQPPAPAAAPGGDAPAPAGAGGGGRGGGPGGPGGAGAAGAPGAAGGGARGGGGQQAAGLPMIGPTGRGSILIAWNPVTQKEAWRGPGGSSGGFNSGGTLSTAGKLVFTNVNNRLYAFKADTGEQLLDLATGISSPGPPMTFMLDGTQYIAIAGATGGGGGGRGGGGRGGAGGGRGPGAAAPGGQQ
jgi:PQQ-dependent dehydrogenase (methanol/ethanol family)